MRTPAVLSLVLVALATTAGAQEHTLDFIWEEAPFPRAHASTIVEAPDGTLIAAWFGGSGEGQKDVGVWSSRRPKGGAWSPPVQLYKEPDQPAWNPVLFRGDGDTIWLYFKIGPSPRAWSGAYMTTTTAGAEWSQPGWLPSGMLGPVRAKPIRLANGDILAGTSLESYRTWSSWMEISSDGGRSWSKHGPLLFGDPERDRIGTIQPTLLELEPGVIRAFFRDAPPREDSDVDLSGRRPDVGSDTAHAARPPERGHRFAPARRRPVPAALQPVDHAAVASLARRVVR